MDPAGFAHSETRGSKGMCPSPRIIAACRVLLRLPVPRHPPCALGIFAFARALARAGRHSTRPAATRAAGALAIRCDLLFVQKKISFATLCGSQGTARASPRDRTLRAGDGEERERRVPPRIVCLSQERILPRKEVIQPHLPVRLPCYDFTPLTLHTFGASPLSVGPATSGADDSGGVTGGVYKARERIHRGVLIRDY